MVAIADIGAQLKTENNYTEPDDDVVEYLVDNAIDIVNLLTGTSIADLTGAASSKTLNGTEGEVALVKLLSGLMLRGYHEKGGGTVTDISVNEMATDPHYKVFMSMLRLGLPYLRGRGFERV